MKRIVSKIWLPLTVIAIIIVRVAVLDGRAVQYRSDLIGAPLPFLYADASLSADAGMRAEADTVIYPHDGYRKGWTEEDYADLQKVDVGFAGDSTDIFGEEGEDTIKLRPVALDTLIAPDSLRYTDSLRYFYYAALRDSLCHVWVRDSLKTAGDTILWPILDSLYTADSLAAAQEAFRIWYNSLSKKERRAYDQMQAFPIHQRRLDSLKAAKDSLKAIKDSIIENTPRVLESVYVPDSLLYKRFFTWTHSRDFHKLKFRDYADTTYNYRYFSYPFLREDTDASWLGVSGSPAQYYDYTKRRSREGVSFYDAQELWTYSPSTLPSYNTKTPYTELMYFGNMFSQNSKSSDNLHLLTTTNITPESNFMLMYDRYGGGGMLDRESTTNKTFVAAGNYIGRRYLMHAGYIYNMVSRQENGGLTDVSMVRDTTVDAREIPIALNEAESKIKRNTFFLDQQYRIPFYFLLSEEAAEAADTLGADANVTTAYIGHSSEYSIFNRWYKDKISNTAGKDFYHNVFNLNPTTSFDSLSVRKFENRVFIRLQPWSQDAIVSKLDAGLGHKLLSYYTFDPSYLSNTSTRHWTSTYLYAGAEGRLKDLMFWDAAGNWSFGGDEAGDFDLAANAQLNFYPFRRHRHSPLSVRASFETSLKEPEYYQQHIRTNHFSWDNSFGKISSSRLQGRVSIPHWRFEASAAYSLLANAVYYDSLGVVRQNAAPISILSAELKKDFVLGALHLDNKVLFQLSSDQTVMPLPTLSLSGRYYVQFPVKKDILDVQIGAHALYNTLWYAPAWNPALGVFHNQSVRQYGNCPYIDLFLNAQWKRACIFVRMENIGMGWPMDKADYFSAHNYIRTQRALKLGIYWPFYTQPKKTGGLIHAPSTSSGGGLMGGGLTGGGSGGARHFH